MDYKTLIIDLIEKSYNDELFELVYRFAKRLLG